MEKIASQKAFNGVQEVYTHQSNTLNCKMNFAIYIPDHQANERLPVLYWLSGLTCTEQNFITKAGAQQYAAEHKVMIVAPDTSPRGEDVANDESYDLGQGAGFYLTATQQPWSAHFNMYDYVLTELRELVDTHFATTKTQSIFGHSMGGLGALVLGLRNPDVYQSISAFSPIVSPSNCPWGVKAFTNYLGQDQSTWGQYDPVVLINNGAQQMPILVEQGLADDFYENQLKTPLLIEACQKQDYDIRINLQEGYDHSYYFIASFIEQHIVFHKQHLNS